MSIGIGNDIVIGRHMGVRLSGGGVAPDPDLLLFDTFTGANNTTLHNRAPDAVNTPGGVWSVLTGAWTIQGNAAKPTTLTGNTGRIVYPLGKSSGRIVFTHTTGQTSGGLDFIQVVFRYADLSNFWYVNLGKVTSGIWQLGKFVAGGATTLGSGTYTYAVNELNIIDIVFNGDAVTATLNGVNELSATDSALASNTGIGLFCQMDGTITNRLSVDDFQVYQL